MNNISLTFVCCVDAEIILLDTPCKEPSHSGEGCAFGCGFLFIALHAAIINPLLNHFPRDGGNLCLCADVVPEIVCQRFTGRKAISLP